MLLHAWQAAAGTPHALRLASDVIPRNLRAQDADTGDHAASLVALRVATQARGQFLHIIDRRAGCPQEQESHIRQRRPASPTGSGHFTTTACMLEGSMESILRAAL
jgi:hypothetical protein